MNRKAWITGFVIASFFAVIALIYFISATDIWKADEPMQKVEGEPSDDKPEQSESGSDEQHKEAVQQPAQVLLQAGDSGAAVQELQEQLNTLGYDLEVDGEYSMTTQWYVKDFRLQSGLTGDGNYDTETEALLQEALQTDAAIEPGKAIHLKLPERTVTNPDDLLVLVNKTRSLPPDYEPEGLVQPDVPRVFQGENLPYNKMRAVAAEALEEMFAHAQQEGLQLVARSGYRSYDTQVAVFARNVEKSGEEYANQYSARPGESEHQTGLVMDVTTSAVNNELVTEFENTPEGQWLQDHAQDYGFIIRYLQGEEDITGYEYEPWHLRYVGIEVATEIAAQNITLEQYLVQK